MRAASIAALCLAAGALACSSSDSSSSCDMDGQAGDGGADARVDGPSDAAAHDAIAESSAGDAQPPGDSGTAPGTDGGSVKPAYVRVANWSPDAPPVDFCLAPHGTGVFQGPVVRALAASQDASAMGLALCTQTGARCDGSTPATPATVSAYFSMPAGSYDARIVVAGAVNCAVGIGQDATMLPSLTGGGFETIALVGEELPSGGDPGQQIVGFMDDGLAPPGGGVSLRFINAAPILAQADFGTGLEAMNSFVPLFRGVGFGMASASKLAPSGGDAAALSVDPQGYVNKQAFSSTLSAHNSTSNMDAVATTGFSAAAGSITIIAVNGTSAGAPTHLLQCVDNAGTVGQTSDCIVLP